MAHFHADSGTIHMLEPDGVLHSEGREQGAARAVLASVRVPVGKGMAGLAVERAEPVGACNIQTDSSGTCGRAPGHRDGRRLVVPIFKGERAVGALGIANRGARTFTPEETAAPKSPGYRVPNENLMIKDDFTRRNFVKSSVALAGSAALLPAQSPNDTVRVAFIGVGNRGSSLLQHMLNVLGIKVVAICDINPETSKKPSMRRLQPATRPNLMPTSAECSTAKTLTPW